MLLYNNIYVQSDDGKLYALGAESGKLLWTYDLAKKSRDRRPDVSQYKIFTTTQDKFVVLDSETGDILWSYHIESAELFSTPLVINGYVIVQAGDYLYIFEQS